MSGALYESRDAQRRRCLALSALPKISSRRENVGPVVIARHSGHSFQTVPPAAHERTAVVEVDDNSVVSAAWLWYDAAHGACNERIAEWLSRRQLESMAKIEAARSERRHAIQRQSVRLVCRVLPSGKFPLSLLSWWKGNDYLSELNRATHWRPVITQPHAKIHTITNGTSLTIKKWMWCRPIESPMKSSTTRLTFSSISDAKSTLLNALAPVLALAITGYRKSLLDPAKTQVCEHQPPHSTLTRREKRRPQLIRMLCRQSLKR